MKDTTTAYVVPHTDVGLVRETNQDCFLVCQRQGNQVFMLDQGKALDDNGDGLLFAVADGVGGAAAGEIASAMSVEALALGYYDSAGQATERRLIRAVKQANKAVFQEARMNPSRAGMGTTMVAAVIKDEFLFLANVGDSRAYLIRDQTMRQLTVDHSYAEMEGLSDEEAEQTAFGHMITRCLGTGDEVEVDTFIEPIQQQDTILLCSDGLIRHVSAQEILDTVLEGKPDENVLHLVGLAKKGGGSDNITVVLAKVQHVVPGDGQILPKRRTPTKQVAQSKKKRGILSYAAWGILCAVLIALLFAGIWFSLYPDKKNEKSVQEAGSKTQKSAGENQSDSSLSEIKNATFSSDDVGKAREGSNKVGFDLSDVREARRRLEKVKEELNVLEGLNVLDPEKIPSGIPDEIKKIVKLIEDEDSPTRAQLDSAMEGFTKIEAGMRGAEAKYREDWSRQIQAAAKGKEDHPAIKELLDKANEALDKKAYQKLPGLKEQINSKKDSIETAENEQRENEQRESEQQKVQLLAERAALKETLTKLERQMDAWQKTDGSFKQEMDIQVRVAQNLLEPLDKMMLAPYASTAKKAVEAVEDSIRINLRRKIANTEQYFKDVEALREQAKGIWFYDTRLSHLIEGNRELKERLETEAKTLLDGEQYDKAYCKLDTLDRKIQGDIQNVVVVGLKQTEAAKTNIGKFPQKGKDSLETLRDEAQKFFDKGEERKSLEKLIQARILGSTPRDSM